MRYGNTLKPDVFSMLAMWSLVILASLLCCLHAYPTGAPPGACISRLPNHLGASPQNSACPIGVKAFTAESHAVTVAIEDEKAFTPFMGFLLGAYHRNGSAVKGGTFTTSPLTKTLECGSRNEISLTHNSKQPKSIISTNWTPPPLFDDTVIFKATILLNFQTFWTGVESSPIDFKSASSPSSASSSTSTKPVLYASSSSTSSRSKEKTPIILPTESPIIQMESSKDLYAGCGTTKGCFGLPGDCVEKRRCELILVYHNTEDQKVRFEMVGALGSVNGWIAMGLSRNAKMGEDSVTECVMMGDRVYVQESWNVATPRKGNVLLTGVPSNISSASGEYENGILSCRWNRPFSTSSNRRTFYLHEEKFYVLLAKGPVDRSGQKMLHTASLPSAQAVDLTAISVVVGKPSTLVKIHGAFMTVAWVCFVSIGILVARHCKEVWMKYKLCGTRVWFSVHRCFMLLSVGLVVSGFIAIFIDIDGWSDVAPNPHPILGCAATGLIILQPFIAMCRPQPTSPKRVIFRWFHGLIGNGAQIIAWVNMFFAVNLTKSNVPEAFYWVMVTFIIFHCLVHLLIHIHSCFMARERERESNTKLHQFQFGDGYEINEDSPGGSFKKFALGLYSLVTIGLTAALVLMVCLT